MHANTDHPSTPLKTQLVQTLTELLAIPSPTHHEQALLAWCQQRLQTTLPDWQQSTHRDSLIVQAPWQDGLPHLALIGHSDVVPTHFEPYQQGERLHGSGASDMKGALAAYLCLLETEAESLLKQFNLSLIIYAREEQTPLKDNGLYHLIEAFPAYFDSLDLAIIGEPTDNTVQLGCVGSIHLLIEFKGQACHSARPWNGQNALYQALPFLNQIAALEPVKQTVFGVPFFDVLQVTESQSEPGRTSLPGWWRGNLNFRFAPVRSEAEAQAELMATLANLGVNGEQCQIIDSVPAGQVLETPLFKQVVGKLGVEIQAKQAWTDVAQLSLHGISAFNFGPGLTSQAHKDDEYILISDLVRHYQLLKQALIA